MARRGRKSESLADALIDLPWQVSIVLALLCFVGLRWILPVMWSSSMYLKPIAMSLSGIAWLFSSVFLLIGIVALAIQKRAVAREASTVREPFLGDAPRPGSQSTAEAASDRPQERREPVDMEWPNARPSAPVGRGLLGEPLYSLSAPAESIATSRPMEWSLDLLRDIEWKRFEDLCQRFYAAKGIRSRATSLGADGGVDVRLYQGDGEDVTAVVQCKAWGARFVGVKPVRELLGVMTHEKIDKAFLMTSSQFSEDAKAFARSNRITLIDGQMLLVMIKRLPVESQDALLDFATAGDYNVPSCPSCGVKMKRVSGKAGRHDFWGCGTFPRCHQKLGMRRSDW
ncbi:restriction endonuclease [Candidatus Accumulibacter phosphatis]|jgi:restriction system protein|uniref:Restriction endonuclease n=2 Tax=Betaproteobacteria incertae sedis TaxID=119066 RepID=C7RPH3_ACCRE